MKNITIENITRLNNNLDEYLKLYGKYYPEGAVDFIKNNYLDEQSFIDEMDIMNQVYQATGTYEEVVSTNPYLKYIREMQENFDLDRHLLEVGSGFYPAMAINIDQLQQKGSITAMDYDSIIEKIKRVNIIKERFSENTDVSKYDMLYGIMPCEAIIPMIYSANKNDKDLFIALCGCTHFENPQNMRYITRQLWYDYIENIVKTTLPRNRKYEIYSKCDISYPLIKTYK